MTQVSAAAGSSDELATRAVGGGLRFGPYTSTKHIASGGMSSVYLADCPDGGPPVAIKTTRPSDLGAAEGLRAEILLLSQLDHPGVVRVLAHGADEKQPWYAMPYHPGALTPVALTGDTADVVADDTEDATRDFGLQSGRQSGPAKSPPRRPALAPRPVDWDRLGVVRQMCDTLAWLHGQGIVHRDLKPSNVVIDDNGHPVLIDFGITARVADQRGRESLAHDPAVAGTRGYMAPEQWTGADVDSRADLYALGCMIYELLVGRLPSEMAPPRFNISQVDIIPPHEVNPNVDDELSALVVDLLAQHPSDRTGFAEDVGDRLEALGAGRKWDGLPDAQPYLHRPSFVGREEVIEDGGAQLQKAGHHLFIVGASGAGKTRAAQELIRRMRTEGREVIMAHCGDVGLDAAGGRSPTRPLQGFAPFLSRLAARCLQGDTRAREVLGDDGAALTGFEPLIGQIVGVDRPALVRVEGAEMKAARVQDAMIAVLNRYANAFLPVLVLDDVQWADELTEGVVKRLLLQPLGDFAGNVMCTMRSEEPWTAFDDVVTSDEVMATQLPVFQAQDVRRLVVEMTADPEPPPELVLQVRDGCAGNPFFVAAYLNESVANGDLVRRRRHWRLREGAGALREPTSLADVLRSRLDRLDDDVRRWVEAGAVLGRKFAGHDAAAIAGTDVARARHVEDVLRVRQIIDDAEDGSVRFAHDKLLENAYERIDRTRRRQMHAAAAAMFKVRENTSPRVLARHYTLAEQPEEAFDYLQVAAQEALAEGRPRLARELLRNARDLASTSGTKLFDQMTSDDKVRFHSLEAKASFAGRDHLACSQSGREGLAASKVWVPTSGFGVFVGVLAAMARQTWQRWAPSSWVTLSGEKAQRARDLRQFWAAVAFHTQHNNEMGAYLMAEINALSAAERGGDWGEAARHQGVLAYVFSFSGMRKLGEKWFDRGVEWARRDDDKVAELVCRSMRCAHHLDGGEWEEAEYEVTLLREECRPLGAREQMVWNTVMCLLTTLFSGQRDKAHRYAQELEEMAGFGDHQQMLGEGATIIAGMYLQEGEHDRALDVTARTITMLEQNGEVALRTCCMIIRAVVHARRGDWVQAWKDVVDVQTLLPDGGGRNFQAYHVHALLPELLLELAATPDALAQLDGVDVDDVLRRTGIAMKACAQQSKQRPLLRPNAARQKAMWAHTQSSSTAAELAAKAVTLARAQRQAFDLALSLMWLAQLPTTSAEVKTQSTQEAEEIFQRLGCSWHLAQLARQPENEAAQ